jgi:hypothetical protein
MVGGLAIYSGGEMQKTKALTLQIAGTFALAMLVGTSAFAESRHLGGTRGGSSRGSSGRGSSSRPSFSSGFGRSASRGPSFGRSAPRGSSNYGRSTPYRGGNYGRSAPRGSSNYGRSTPYRGGGNFYNNGSRFYGRGRIERVVPYHGGYRVWLGGWGYPFYVPYSYWDPFRFRLGLFIGFNAFYDPLGYYNVYGWPGYGYPPVYSGTSNYRDDNSYDNSYDETVVRGTVESVDLHEGTVVLNDSQSRRTITALLPPRDNRVDEIRVGDYVEFSGGWTRRGQFDADRMDRIDPRRQ